MNDNSFDSDEEYVQPSFETQRGERHKIASSLSMPQANKTQASFAKKPQKASRQSKNPQQPIQSHQNSLQIGQIQNLGANSRQQKNLIDFIRNSQVQSQQFKSLAQPSNGQLLPENQQINVGQSQRQQQISSNLQNGYPSNLEEQKLTLETKQKTNRILYGRAQTQILNNGQSTSNQNQNQQQLFLLQKLSSDPDSEQMQEIISQQQQQRPVQYDFDQVINRVDNKNQNVGPSSLPSGQGASSGSSSVKQRIFIQNDSPSFNQQAQKQNPTQLDVGRSNQNKILRIKPSFNNQQPKPTQIQPIQQIQPQKLNLNSGVINPDILQNRQAPKNEGNQGSRFSLTQNNWNSNQQKILEETKVGQTGVEREPMTFREQNQPVIDMTQEQQIQRQYTSHVQNKIISGQGQVNSPNRQKLGTKSQHQNLILKAHRVLQKQEQRQNGVSSFGMSNLIEEEKKQSSNQEEEKVHHSTVQQSKVIQSNNINQRVSSAKMSMQLQQSLNISKPQNQQDQDEAPIQEIESEEEEKQSKNNNQAIDPSQNYQRESQNKFTVDQQVNQTEIQSPRFQQKPQLLSQLQLLGAQESPQMQTQSNHKIECSICSKKVPITILDQHENSCEKRRENEDRYYASNLNQQIVESLQVNSASEHQSNNQMNATNSSIDRDFQRKQLNFGDILTSRTNQRYSNQDNQRYVNLDLNPSSVQRPETHNYRADSIGSQSNPQMFNQQSNQQTVQRQPLMPRSQTLQLDDQLLRQRASEILSQQSFYLGESSQNGVTQTNEIQRANTAQLNERQFDRSTRPQIPQSMTNPPQNISAVPSTFNFDEKSLRKQQQQEDQNSRYSQLREDDNYQADKNSEEIEEEKFNEFEYEAINLQEYNSRVREFNHINGSFSQMPDGDFGKDDHENSQTYNLGQYGEDEDIDQKEQSFIQRMLNDNGINDSIQLQQQKSRQQMLGQSSQSSGNSFGGFKLEMDLHDSEDDYQGTFRPLVMNEIQQQQPQFRIRRFQQSRGQNLNNSPPNGMNSNRFSAGGFRGIRELVHERHPQQRELGHSSDEIDNILEFENQINETREFNRAAERDFRSQPHRQLQILDDMDELDDYDEDELEPRSSHLLHQSSERGGIQQMNAFSQNRGSWQLFRQASRFERLQHQQSEADRNHQSRLIRNSHSDIDNSESSSGSAVLNPNVHRNHFMPEISSHSLYDRQSPIMMLNQPNRRRLIQMGILGRPQGQYMPGRLMMEENSVEDISDEGHDSRAENSFDNYEALINLDEDVVQSVPKKLLDMLPTSKFTEGNKANFSEENKSCTICMSAYEIQEEYMILPCLHRFHSECIKEWFNRRNTCPNCKDRVCDHFEEEMKSIRQPRASQLMNFMNGRRHDERNQNRIHGADMLDYRARPNPHAFLQFPNRNSHLPQMQMRRQSIPRRQRINGDDSPPGFLGRNLVVDEIDARSMNMNDDFELGMGSLDFRDRMLRMNQQHSPSRDLTLNRIRERLIRFNEMAEMPESPEPLRRPSFPMNDDSEIEDEMDQPVPSMIADPDRIPFAQGVLFQNDFNQMLLNLNINISQEGQEYYNNAREEGHLGQSSFQRDEEQIMQGFPRFQMASQQQRAEIANDRDSQGNYEHSQSFESIEF